MYTTHGLMTPADLADHEALTDTGRNPQCPGHDDDPVGQYGQRYYCSQAENCTADDEEWPRVPSRVAARDEPCADPANCDIHR